MIHSSKVCRRGFRSSRLAGSTFLIVLLPFSRAKAQECVELQESIPDDRYALYARALGPGNSGYAFPLASLNEAQLTFRMNGVTILSKTTASPAAGEADKACVRFLLPKPRSFPTQVEVKCPSNPYVACDYRVELDAATNETGEAKTPVKCVLKVPMRVSLAPDQAQPLIDAGLGDTTQLALGDTTIDLNASAQVVVSDGPPPGAAQLSSGAVGCVIVAHASSGGSADCTAEDMVQAQLSGTAKTFVDKNTSQILTYRARRNVALWADSLPEAERVAARQPWVALIVTDNTLRTVPPPAAAGAGPSHLAAQVNFVRDLSRIEIAGQRGTPESAKAALKIIGAAPQNAFVVQP